MLSTSEPHSPAPPPSSSSTPENMLRLYGVAASLTAEILAHAQADDWDSVIALGSRYIAVIEQIQKLGDMRPLDAEERARKHALIVAILENDAATRELAHPSLSRLSALLGNLKRQQSLNTAYGASALSSS